MFDINGGNINKSPPEFQTAKQENTQLPYLAANAIWVNDGALCCRSLGERTNKHSLLII